MGRYHVYIPRYNQLSGTRHYAGGWGIQVNFNSYMFPYQATKLKGYGAQFKQQVRNMQPGFSVFPSAFGKTVSTSGNYVSVDPSRPDEYGIPAP